MPSLPLDEFMLEVSNSQPSTELETARASKRFFPALRASTATAQSGRHTQGAVSAKPKRTRPKRQMMNVTSIGESKLLGIQDDELLSMQRHTIVSHMRGFPLGLRTDSSNMDPLLGWRAGVSMMALNLQTPDLPTQLHYALFELSGGHGYVLKPAQMRQGLVWPPARETVMRVSLNVISLHHLPARGEQRPDTKTGRHARCHDFTCSANLSGTSVPPKASAASVSSPSVQLEVHSIGGFCCVSDSAQPKVSQVTSSFRTRTVIGNGLAAEFGQVVHCLAAEPRETILRLVVLDGDAEVACETAVLGALREGYRCFQLRHKGTGTRIQLCSLLVHIAVGEERNVWAEGDMLRRLLEQQKEKNQRQRERIKKLKAKLQADDELTASEDDTDASSDDHEHSSLPRASQILLRRSKSATAFSATPKKVVIRVTDCAQRQSSPRSRPQNDEAWDDADEPSAASDDEVEDKTASTRV